MDWLKLNSKGILRGSLARADIATQLIWIKFLALANETRDRDGYLRYKEGQPYSLEYIAMVCNVTKEQLDIAIDDFIDDIRDGHQRIEFAPDGSIKLNNWLKYQNQPPEKEASPRIIKSASELEAITRKNVRRMPDVATDELIKVTEEKAHVNDINNQIEAIKDRVRGNKNE